MCHYLLASGKEVEELQHNSCHPWQGPELTSTAKAKEALTELVGEAEPNEGECGDWLLHVS